jgi:hypothetical protein
MMARFRPPDGPIVPGRRPGWIRAALRNALKKQGELLAAARGSR